MSFQQAKAANRLLLNAMLLAASYISMRTVGDSLFLSRVGNESLAAVFVASGIATFALAALWHSITRRWSLSRALKVSTFFSVGLTLACWAALPYFHHSWLLLAAIYLLTELKGCVNSINVVAGTNEILGGHSSRQAWARIGLGAPLAAVVIGTLIGAESHLVSARTWLLLSVAFDLLALWPLRNTARLVVQRTQTSGSDASEISVAKRTPRIRDGKYVKARSFRFWIGCLIAAKIVVLTFVAFRWKVSVNDYFAGSEQAITRYFGIFYACIGVLTLLVQLFITGRLLESRRIRLPILAMPLTLGAFSAVLMLGAGPLFMIVLLTLAKSSEVWRRSVQDTTLNLLYTRIKRPKRRSTISFSTAIVKPLAEVGASTFLLIASAAWYKPTLLIAVAAWIIAATALLKLVTNANGKLPKETAVPSAVKNQIIYSEPV